MEHILVIHAAEKTEITKMSIVMIYKFDLKHLWHASNIMGPFHKQFIH